MSRDTSKRPKRPRTPVLKSLPIVVTPNKNMYGGVTDSTAHLGEFTATGSDPAAAVRNLQCGLVAASQQRYDVYLAQWRGQIYAASFDPRTMQWQLRHCAAAAPEEFTAFWMTGGGTAHYVEPATETDPELLDGSGARKAERIVSAKTQRELAAAEWQPQDGYAVPDLGAMFSNAEKADVRAWIEFQLRYRDAQARGLSDNAAFCYAGRDPQRAELWAHEPRDAARPELTLLTVS